MNEQEIKKITSLAHAKYRNKYGLFLVEGMHLVEELLKSAWQTESLIIREEESHSDNIKSYLENASKQGIPIKTLKPRLFEKLSTTESPQGIMAVVQIPEVTLEQIFSRERILVADGISDPGNLGTIIRSAAAFGFDGILCTVGTVDLYSPKVVRATQGAIFKVVAVENIRPVEIVERLKSSYTVYALSPHKGANIDTVKITPKLALVVGAEIGGIAPEFLKAADYSVRIPMAGPVESLNAAVAAGIAMFEFSRA